MKRSEIDRHIDWAIALCQKQRFALPAFTYWSPMEWDRRRAEAEHLWNVMQGWDATDYARGDFDKVGAVLFTLRNGNTYDPSMGTPYCEKIITMKAGQLLPMHFHYSKTEDIINRAGGTLCVKVFNSKSEAEGFAIDTQSDVHLRLDGRPVTLPAGAAVEVGSGDSITLFPYIYHEFYAKPEDGDLIVGEVSTINDDRKDNHFAEPFTLPPIQEDVPARHHLCNGYVQQ